MAWQRYATKISDRPNWKKKKINKSVSIYGKGTRPFKIVKDGLILAKIGYIKAVLHRTAVGRIKSYRIFRDVNQWFVSILCEQEVPDPPKKHEPVIGIDRGITNLVADSNGSVVPNPKHWEKMHKKLARVQRVASRRKRGSKRCDKAKERVAKIHRKIRRQRAHILHQLSAWYAKTFGVVVVEDLNVAGMSKGKLARQINNAGWSALITMIRYKIEAVGGRVELVPAAYSSQTCAQCQNVDKASRQGERYNCTKCGNQAHADVNAAKVLVQRYNSRRSDGEAVRGGYGEASRPAKRKMRVVRRVNKTYVGIS
jgi:putative transposase